MRKRPPLNAFVFVVAAAVVGCGKSGRVEFTNVVITQERLTLSRDDGGSLAFVDRQTSPDVYFRATLTSVPKGVRLPMTCNWIDPAGRTVHQNAYETLAVTKPVWDTHCHFLIGTALAPGDWKVEMLLDGRPLGTHAFVVR